MDEAEDRVGRGSSQGPRPTRVREPAARTVAEDAGNATAGEVTDSHADGDADAIADGGPGSAGPGRIGAGAGAGTESGAGDDADGTAEDADTPGAAPESATAGTSNDTDISGAPGIPGAAPERVPAGSVPGPGVAGMKAGTGADTRAAPDVVTCAGRETDGDAVPPGAEDRGGTGAPAVAEGAVGSDAADDSGITDTSDAASDDADEAGDPDGLDGPGDADDAPAKDPVRRAHRWPAWVELPALVAIGLTLVLLTHIFVAQPFVIPSGSMENTLRVGDRVLVNKLAYRFDDIRRGDVVVFDGEGSFSAEGGGGEPDNAFARAAHRFGALFGFTNSGETDFVKRVIGIGGDRVVCCDADGRITVNGVALDESSYLYPGDRPSEQRFDIVVPPGKLWVMGDHRSNSADSRAHIGDPGGGFVPESRVVGRVQWVIWPLGGIRGVDRPATFSQPGIGVQVHPVERRG